MAIIIDKVIPRNTDNIINIDTNYNELNLKASNLVEDIVGHMETQLNTIETVSNTAVNTIVNNAITNANTQLSSYTTSAASSANIATSAQTAIQNNYAAYIAGTTYSQTAVDARVNALAPYSGYMNWKENNFVFQTSSSFLASIADKNRYIKFGDKVVDTYGTELWNATPSSSATYYDFTLDKTKTYIISCNKKSTGGFAVYNGTSLADADRITDYIYTTGYSYLYIPTHSANTIRVYISDTFANIDNISVREIRFKSAVDLVPDVIVQDQTTYGLTTQSSVLAGDYVVVDRQDLVTNGTFDSDTYWSKDTYWTISSGTANIVSTSTVQYLTQSSPSSSISGKVYVITGEISNYVSGNLTVRFNSSYSSTSASGNGKFTLLVTANANNAVFRMYASPYSSFSIDNISVKQVDEVYRAKVDTASGSLLTDTTKFEVRDNLPISNQIAFLHTYNTTTSSYEGITNDILFVDALAIETPKAILLKNGYSEVSKGLYSKGSKLYVFAGYWQTLNKGAYHPVFNMAGTKALRSTTNTAASTRNWYYASTSLLGGGLNSISEAFNYTLETFQNTSWEGNGTIGSPSYGFARPDGKAYDIIYQDQFISFNHSELAYKPTDSEKKRIREYEKYRGVEGLIVTEQKLQTTTGTVATLEVNDDTKYLVGDYVQIWTGTTAYRQKVISISSNTLTLDASIVKTAVNFTISCKRYAYNSKGTSLTTDLIGSPTNYPTIMKDRLNEGKGIFGVNPLLVGQDGTSYTSGTFDYIYGKKNIVALNQQYMDSPFATWISSSYTPNYITNSRGSSYSYGSQIILANYTAQNNPYQATTPKAVSSVEPKVIASNSHSIYKGAIVGNCIGKVQVGNGSNGYESKVLENSEVGDFNILYAYITKTTYEGVSYLLVGNDLPQKGKIFTKVAGGTYDVTANISSNFGAPNWKEGSNIILTPTHSTIVLDNANSPASKWFEGICYDDDYEYPFVVMEELAYNTTSSSYNGDDNKFTVLANGTVTDANNKVCVAKFMIGNPIGRRN